MGYTSFGTNCPRRHTMSEKSPELPTVAAAVGWLSLLLTYLPVVLELLANLKKRQENDPAPITFSPPPECTPEVKAKIAELVALL